MRNQGPLFIYSIVFPRHSEIGHSHFSKIGRELDEDINRVEGIYYIRTANIFFEGMGYWR